MHRLFVDDTREFPKWGYECCQTAEHAILLLSVLEFESISLDYSLGRNCKTGLDIMIWMYENHIYVPEINIHSDHIIGRERMYEFCKIHFLDSKVKMKTLSR